MDHVALGSDFDGSMVMPFDAVQLCVLPQAVIDAYFTGHEIRKVTGDNRVRFFRQNLPVD